MAAYRANENNNNDIDDDKKEEEINNAEKLAGKVVLVTGASSGLGREFCLHLVAAGCRVVASARRTQLLESLVSEIESRHGQKNLIATLPMDVSAHEAHIEAAVHRAWQAFGRIDVLVNNAGIRGSIKSPLELDEDEWNRVFDTNMRGVWLVSKALSKLAIQHKLGCSIIIISSIAGLDRGLLPGAVAYNSSKASAIHITKTLALELGKYNIRVNGIAPGLFVSEITIALLNKPWVHDIAPKMVPMQRQGLVHPDLTSIVLFLASDHSSFITGNTFIIDGGQSIAGIRLRSSL